VLLAQDTTPAEDKSVERMQVTGSHIRRTDAEGPLPVTIIDREVLDKSGFENLQQVLERLPSAGSGTFSTRGNSQDSTANGAAAISLRGFGADATLVLINGRRVANNAFAEGITNNFVDINSIPVAAIERIDILKDGASATYGSDAIAGVVNVVLRKDYSGTEVSLSHGATTGPNYDETTFSTVWGTGDAKSNTTLIFDYFSNSQLDNSELGRWGTANQKPYGGADLRSSRGFPGRFEVDGVILRDPGCPAAQVAGQTCVYDYGPSSITLPEAERVGLLVNSFRKLTDDVELFAELAVQHNISVAGGAATPLDEGAKLTVPGTHPNNPWKKDIKISRYRTVDAGNRRWDITSDTLRALVGVRGQLEKYDWEMAVSKGRSAATQTGDRDQGWVRTDFLQREINAGRYNPFGGVQNPQSVVDAITTSLVRRGESHLTAADARFSGELLDMPHGPLGIAAGVEYRSEDGKDTPDDQFVRGLIFGTESVSAAASRNQHAAYVEFSVPVLENLELQLAQRYDHYSDFGSSSNPKVAFHYKANDAISLRGSWSQGFRAPSLAQVGLGPSQKSQFFVDTFLCPVASTNNPACASTDYTIVFAGNPDLKAEESESWNVGVIWQLNDQFDITADLWSVTQDNKIDKVPYITVYNAHCNNQASAICVRQAPLPGQRLGFIDRLNTTLVNFSSQEAQGLDLSANYKLDLANLGRLKLNVEATYLSNFEKNGIDFTGEFRYPQYRWVTSADWAVTNDWGLASSISYVGEFEDFATEDKVESTTSRTVDAFYSLDMQAYYNLSTQLKVSVGGSNLLDKEPPFALGDGNSDLYGYVSSMYNPRGRYIYAKVSYKF
jgi:outer membrane receptor for ferrienterochelin and colicin